MQDRTSRRMIECVFSGKVATRSTRKLPNKWQLYMEYAIELPHSAPAHRAQPPITNARSAHWFPVPPVCGYAQKQFNLFRDGPTARHTGRHNHAVGKLGANGREASV